MTTGWLLLLLVIASSQSADAESVCAEDLMNELKGFIQQQNEVMKNEILQEVKSDMQKFIRMECPADFMRVQTVNGCYKLVNRNLNWTAAGQECRSLHKDAHLLIISDAYEQSTIAKMLAAVSEDTLSTCLSNTRDGHYLWTAGQRVDPTTESTFVWRVTSTTGETTSALSYTNWASDQPNYYMNKKQACLDLMPTRSYTWNDHECDLEVCSVCEIDL